MTPIHHLPRPSSSPRYGLRESQPPVVAVITPYYNTGTLFFETVESVLRQSLQQWEWIIVNDGSNDHQSLDVLMALRDGDARIRVLDCPHAGLVAARNAGVAASSAPLLFFLDSDDLIAFTSLEKLAWGLEANPESMFAGSWAITFGREQIAWRRGFDSRHAFLYENMKATPAAMVRRSLFERVGGFANIAWPGLEDYELWLRSAAHGYWGHDVPEYLLHVRRKPAQAYTSYAWAFDSDPQEFARFRRAMRARYPALYQEGLPRPKSLDDGLTPYAQVVTDLPFTNPLSRLAHQRHVLLLLPWMRVGGVERFALDLVAGLVAGGDRVTVCLLRSDEPSTWLGELERLTPDVFNLAAFLRIADYPRFLCYLIRSRGITTVLISNSMLAYQLLPYLRAQCPEVAFADFLHIEEEQWRAGGFPRIALDYDELLDLHITSSQHLRQWMIARGGTPHRIEVCTTNIDTRGWAPDPELRQRVRAELRVAEDLPIILFVGRMVAQKRPRFALEILAELRRRGLGFVGLFAGDGEEHVWMRCSIALRGLREDVHMLGAVSHQRVHELLSAADILLLPSEHEGIALNLFEALAMAVVPVGAQVGGQAELVTPDCGVLIARGPGELIAYADALERLIREPIRRREMGLAGQARVAEHFTIEQMRARILVLLDNALQRARTAPGPAISHGVGLATAQLAIEHQLLESRLRAATPFRQLLRLRRTPVWRWLVRLTELRTYIERSDRILYIARRKTMERVRMLRPRRRAQRL